MKHKVKLVWNAFMWNNSEVETFNVIDDGLIQDIEKAYKKKELNKLSDLKEIAKKYFMWRYWSKVEYETLIESIFPMDDKCKKIDVYWQLEMNLDRIVEYINREMEIL